MRARQRHVLFILLILLPWIARGGTAQTDEKSSIWLVQDERGEIVEHTDWGFVSVDEVADELRPLGFFWSHPRCLRQERLLGLEGRSGNETATARNRDGIKLDDSRSGLLWARRGDSWGYAWTGVARQADELKAVQLRPTRPLEVHLEDVPDGACFQLYIRQHGSLEMRWIAACDTEGPRTIRIPDLRALRDGSDVRLWLGVRGPGFRGAELDITTSNAASVNFSLAAYEVLRIPTGGSPERQELLIVRAPGSESSRDFFFSHDMPDRLPLRRTGDVFQGLLHRDIHVEEAVSARLYSADPDAAQDFRLWNTGLANLTTRERGTAPLVRIDEIRFQATERLEDLSYVSLAWDIEGTALHESHDWELVRLHPTAADETVWTASLLRTFDPELLSRAYVVCRNAHLEVLDSYVLTEEPARFRGETLDISRTPASRSNLFRLVLPEIEEDEVLELHSVAARPDGTGRRQFPRASPFHLVANENEDFYFLLTNGKDRSTPVFRCGEAGAMKPQMETLAQLDIEMRGLPESVFSSGQVLCLLEGPSVASLALTDYEDFDSYCQPLYVSEKECRVLFFLEADGKLSLKGLARGDLAAHLAWPGSAGFLKVLETRIESDEATRVVDLDPDVLHAMRREFRNETSREVSIWFRPEPDQQVLVEQLPDHLRLPLLRLNVLPSDTLQAWTHARRGSAFHDDGRLKEKLSVDAVDVVLTNPKRAPLRFREEARDKLRRAAGREVALIFEGTAEDDPLDVPGGLFIGPSFEIGGSFCSRRGLGIGFRVWEGDEVTIRVVALRPGTAPGDFSQVRDWDHSMVFELFEIPARRYRSSDLNDLVEGICKRLETYDWEALERRDFWETSLDHAR